MNPSAPAQAHARTQPDLDGRPLRAVVAAMSQLILGKDRQVRLALTCLLAGGHLLIEDVPGVGKTTLAQTLARVLGLQFSRVQFTSDLLPNDILGVSMYNPGQEQGQGSFSFHPGPIFSQLVLADEVNRASPKTQSALLEAMEERQVTIDGETRALPSPFFVVATQNPSDQIGTFVLPESQLDRFLMRIELGYPDAAAERALLQQRSRRDMLPEVQATISPADFTNLQAQVARVRVSDALLDYIVALVKYSRESSAFRLGLSPRAGLALRQVAQAWALLQERDYVLPEDVQAILPCVVDHRLTTNEGISGEQTPGALLLKAVPIP